MKKPVKVGDSVIMASKFGKSFLRQDFQYPDNTIKDFYLFDYKNGEAPIVALGITEDQHVIGIQQFRHAANSVVIEIAGGVSKNDTESPEDIILREFPEETGYVPENIIRLSNVPIWFDPVNFTVPYWPFLATHCRKKQEQALDETEMIEPIIVPIETWISWIFNGTIRDSKTITTTFLALPHLEIYLSRNNTKLTLIG